MGYFSNGTEGDMYEADYCNNCVHQDPDRGCPVWDAHLFFSYELCNEKDHPGKVMLDMFIPREGIENKRCTMFVSRDGALPGQRKMFAAKVSP